MSQLTKPEPQDELAWLAFRYVAGELSPTEVEQFEERMAVDQAAREALAQSVELYHAIAAAEASVITAVAKQPVVSLPARDRSQHLAWLVAGMSAAAVLVMAGWNAGWFGPAAPLAGNNNVAHVTAALAVAWTEMQADATAGDDESGDDELALHEALLQEEVLSISTEAPSWMTAAVLGIAGNERKTSEATPLDAAESRPQEN
ncbi:hypothetical protein NA78x_002561 [Anatilimnocola sp. NA78]|uniref:hypothetical protein n=1 Tax=Anatilimnocola sp. NA78 TaxID=3415683 RepID=UPI003CE49C5F